MKFNFQLKALKAYLQTILCSTTHIDISIRLIDDYDNKQLVISYDHTVGWYHVVYIVHGIKKIDDHSETINIDLDMNFIKVEWVDECSEIKKVHLYEPRIMEDMI